ncbi:MAG TPA: hypothetical protein VF945_05955, partial [Polyangia bacterium]
VEPRPTPKGGPRPEPMTAPPVQSTPPPVESAPPRVERAAPPVESALPPVEKAPPLVVAQPPPPPAPRTRSFFKDPAACTLTFLGVAGVATGVGLVVAGKLDDNNVAKTADLGQKTTLYDRAGVLLPAGYVALGVGAALVVAGVVEWAAHGRHAAPSTRAARAAWSF